MCGRKDESDLTQQRPSGRVGVRGRAGNSLGVFKSFPNGDARVAESGMAVEAQARSDWRFVISEAGSAAANGALEIAAEGEGATVKAGRAAAGAGVLEVVVD